MEILSEAQSSSKSFGMLPASTPQVASMVNLHSDVVKPPPVIKKKSIVRAERPPTAEQTVEQMDTMKQMETMNPISRNIVTPPPT